MKWAMILVLLKLELFFFFTLFLVRFGQPLADGMRIKCENDI